MNVSSVDLSLADAYRAAMEHVRAWDEDRYLATLFAPGESQHHLYALYAFSAEIARVRSLVREPMPGEIRFQWWRDLIAGKAPEDAGGHPIARALMATITACRLPAQPFLDLIEARTFDLYDDPMPTWLDCEGYCGETSSALIRLASLCLAGGQDMGGAEAAGHAGVAYALTGLLRAFPWTSRRGQLFLPREVFTAHKVTPDEVRAGTDSPGMRRALADVRARALQHLERTRAAIEAVPVAARPAFFPVCLVEPYLRKLEAAASGNPFTTTVDLFRLRKLWIFWLQARRAGCRR